MGWGQVELVEWSREQQRMPSKALLVIDFSSEKASESPSTQPLPAANTSGSELYMEEIHYGFLPTLKNSHRCLVQSSLDKYALSG